MQVGPPIDAFQQVPQKRGDVVYIEIGRVFLGDDEQVLGERQLPLPEKGVGTGQQFHWLAALCVRHVSLAADR